MVDGAFEDAVVVGTGHGGELVFGWVGGLGLEEFLEFAFGVVEGGDGFEFAKGVAKGAENVLAGFVVAAVEEDGAEEGFVGVGEVGGTVAAAGGFFAAGKDEVFAKSEAFGLGGEGAAVDHLGAGFGERAFADAGEAGVEFAGEDEAEDRVAEEFQALVVRNDSGRFMCNGGVGKGEFQQVGLLELVAEAFLE